MNNNKEILKKLQELDEMGVDTQFQKDWYRDLENVERAIKELDFEKIGYLDLIEIICYCVYGSAVLYWGGRKIKKIKYDNKFGKYELVNVFVPTHNDENGVLFDYIDNYEDDYLMEVKKEKNKDELINIMYEIYRRSGWIDALFLEYEIYCRSGWIDALFLEKKGEVVRYDRKTN